MTALDLPDSDETATASAATTELDPASGLRADLVNYATLGGFTLTSETHAWYAAADTVNSPEEARAASTVLAELRGRDLPATRAAADRLLAETSLSELDTVVAVGKAIALALRIRSTMETLTPTAYESEQLAALAAATGTGQWRKEQGSRLTFGQRLHLGRAARGLAVAKRPRKAALHSALAAAAAERAEWNALAAGDGERALPVDPAFLNSATLDGEAQAIDAACEALAELGRLLPGVNPATLPLKELTDLVDRLAADEGTLHRLPALRALRDGIERGGLGDLLDELAAARADGEAAAEAYDRREAASGASLGLLPNPRVEDTDADADADADVETDVDAETVAEVAAEAEVLAEAAVAVETAVLVEAPAEVVAEVIAEPVAEVVAEPIAEPVAEVIAEPVAEVVAEPIAEPAAEPVAEVIAEPVAEVVAEVVAEPMAEVVAEPVAEVVAEPIAEPAAEVVAEVVAKPVAKRVVKPVVEPVAEVVAEPVAEVVAEAAAGAAAQGRRPRKPAITAGRPITAYPAEDLLALVRWMDSDGTDRSDDELLRAAMKELGFTRIGPRIKEALGAAVAEARG